MVEIKFHERRKLLALAVSIFGIAGAKKALADYGVVLLLLDFLRGIISLAMERASMQAQLQNATANIPTPTINDEGYPKYFDKNRSFSGGFDFDQTSDMRFIPANDGHGSFGGLWRNKASNYMDGRLTPAEVKGYSVIKSISSDVYPTPAKGWERVESKTIRHNNRIIDAGYDPFKWDASQTRDWNTTPQRPEKSDFQAMRIVNRNTQQSAIIV